jgi:hypothetical protein
LENFIERETYRPINPPLFPLVNTFKDCKNGELVSKVKTLLTENLQGVVEEKRLLDIVYLAGVLSRISGLYIPDKKHIGIKNLMMACI